MKLTTGLLIAFSYFIFAVFGQLFDIEPGFASPIWPAAGVALALYLKYERPALIWLFIGSYVFGIVYQSSLAFNTILSQSLMSAGAIVQVVITKILLQRFRLFPVRLDSVHTSFKTLLFAGPVACVIEASFGALTLFAFNMINSSDILFIWATWWIGDTMGVLFFFTVAMSLIQTSTVEQNGLKNRVSIGITAAVLFAFVVFGFTYSKKTYHQTLDFNFEKLSQQQLSEFDSVKKGMESHLVSISALFRNQNYISREEFKHYAEDINQNLTLVKAVGFISYVAHDDLALWHDELRDNNLPDVYLKTISSAGFVTPAPNDYYLPITYIEPQSENRMALGLDVRSHNIASAAALDSIKSGKVHATPPLQIDQNGENYAGNVLYFPIYERDQDQNKIIGVAELVLELNDLIKLLLSQSSSNELYHYSVADLDYSDEPFISDVPNHAARVNKSYTVEWFGRQWLFSFYSTEAYETASKDWLSWLTLIMGLLIATLGIIFIMILTGFNNQLQQKVAAKTAELENVIVDLENASKAKTTFLANMSHEYRTPLNAIIGFVDIANAKIKDADALVYFKRIRHSSELMLNAINQVLDISKIEAGKLSQSPVEFNLDETLTRLDDVFSNVAESKGIKFIMSVSPDEPITIYADQSRIEQVATNLIGNAIKFTSEGSVTVKVTVHQNRPAQLTLSIIDTGIGITKSKQAALFQQFEQADDSITREYGGTGLGLTIAKQLTELMGGELTLSSKPNEGSNFTFTIPTKIISVGTPKETTNSDKQPLNLNVLLVEDNPINQVVAKEMLLQMGCKVQIANNGQQAIETLEELIADGSEHPDVILMDIQMPVMGGLEATEHILAREEFKTIPVVGLSANTSKEDFDKAQNAGMVSYLTKPIKITALDHELKKYYVQQ